MKCEEQMIGSTSGNGPALLPRPQRWTPAGGVFALPGGASIGAGGDARALEPAVATLGPALAGTDGAPATMASAFADATVRLTLDPAAESRPQGYRIEIAPRHVKISATDAAGLFYGATTLAQLLNGPDKVLPLGTIDDWPDFLQRGAMLDISRDKVPTMATLRGIVDDLASWKINHLQLYMEHTFAYRNHRAVWEHASPMTAEEVRELDAYCRERFIELAPNQNSFGHMLRWLQHDAYRHLAESPDGSPLPNGEWRDGPWSLDPTHPGSLDLLRELYAELLPNFHSRIFHVGCDEAWDLGCGASKALCAAKGRDQVFVDFLASIKQLVTASGHTMHYWGDMIWQHRPEPEIPLAKLDRDAVMVDWGYIRDYPFDAHGEALAREGIPFWFAPGTSAWSTFIGCNEAAFGSNRSATVAGNKHGAGGILNTDWGDGGHWQHLPVSYIGLAAGAAMAWCESENSDDAITQALDRHVFHDAAAVMGGIAHGLADAWTQVVPDATQACLLDRLLRNWQVDEHMSVESLRTTDAYVADLAQRIGSSRMARPDADLVQRELANGVATVRHACRLGEALLRDATDKTTWGNLVDDLDRIMNERRTLWMERNREGGLDDSLRVLEQRLAEYRRKGS